MGKYDVVAALQTEGAAALVWDPMHSEEELLAAGLTPIAPPFRATAAIVHTNHQEIADLRHEDAPFVDFIVDGRGVIDPSNWPGVVVWRMRVPRPDQP